MEKSSVFGLHEAEPTIKLGTPRSALCALFFNFVTQQSFSGEVKHEAETLRACKLDVFAQYILQEQLGKYGRDTI
jgi:hypothetical protein